MFTPSTTTVILTGHSRGLGQGMAQALLAKGYSVLGLSRKPATWADGRARGLHEVRLDLSNTAELESYLSSAEFRELGQVAESVVLINNAGAVGPIGSAGQVDGADIARSVALNVACPLMITNAVAAWGKPGRIAHVSSGAGRSAYAGWGVYCATKAALDHHARAHALDGMEHLAVVSVAPGVIDTDMQSEIRQVSPSHFPNQPRFVSMKENGQLADLHEAGAAMIDYLFSRHFGSQPVVDLRNLSTQP